MISCTFPRRCVKGERQFIPRADRFSSYANLQALLILIMKLLPLARRLP